MANNVFEELEELLDRMSEGIEGGVGPEAVRKASLPVDVVDEGDRYVVRADLPGYAADDVDLTLSGRRLEVAADRETEIEATDGDYVRRERQHEQVRRSITLPEEVVEDEVSAGLDDGVLTVHLPKVHEQAGKEIEIDDG